MDLKNESLPPDFLLRIEKCRFHMDNPINSPDPIISIDGSTISTNGNLTTIIGQAKAGKSALLNGIISGAIASVSGTIDTLGVTVLANGENKAVIHIDTEQAKHNFYGSIKNVLLRAGREKEPTWFMSYTLRQFEIQERLQALQILFHKAHREFEGIHIAFIDGIADFVASVNDETECNMIVHEFEKLAIQYDCVIVLILHFNPGSEKGRGHLGSQLERKSESVIAVSKDKDSEISTIDGKLLRNAGLIPKLQFKYDKEKGHHVYHGVESPEEKERKKREEWLDLANRVFKDKPYLHTNELKALIKQEKSVRDDRANQIMKLLRDKKITEYVPDSNKQQQRLVESAML